MDPPDTWIGLWAPPLPFCLEPGIIRWTGLVHCCLCSSDLIYFVLQEYITLLRTCSCCGKDYMWVAGSGVQKGERECDMSAMICWCFQARGCWQNDAGVLKIKGLEPKLTVLKFRSNGTEISGFSEVQKSCTWNQNHAFELDFQSLVLTCYYQMVHDISAGTWGVQSRCP